MFGPRTTHTYIFRAALCDSSRQINTDTCVQYMVVGSTCAHAMTQVRQSVVKLLQTPLESEVEVCGWIRSVRISKNTLFVQVHDGSNTSGIQLVQLRKPSCATESDSASSGNAVSGPGTALEVGASVVARGVVKASPTNSQHREVHVNCIQVLGASPSNIYPLQKKYMTPEYLREHLHLRYVAYFPLSTCDTIYCSFPINASTHCLHTHRLRTQRFCCITRIRSAVLLSLQEFLHRSDFTQVTVPVLTPLDCEGGGAVFEVTTKPDGFFSNQKTYLSVSGQLYLEVAAAAFAKVFCLGPTFRAEHSNTTKHLAEFWMLELEMSFAKLQQVMEVCELVIKHVLGYVLRACAEELHTLQHCEAVDTLVHEVEAGRAVFQRRPVFGEDLSAEHERYLVEVYCKNTPVFVTRYPGHLKPFYMARNSIDGTAECFDLLFPWVGEVCGGSQRENIHERLLQQMQHHRLHVPSYQWYLQLRQFGSTPHAGWGLGFDRLLMFLTATCNVRDVVLAPRAYDSLTM
uniref:Asparagine--tRNA ligase n=1 Tax=Lygus hesperus TaxID=30085 RepID=A0A0A9YG50_LYGHE